ncbi:acyltransferase family protein [Conyzicola lurida]|uniref:acyltransferase family protein n=1 Tax=Conyzicola lurida TaxID=1172621 RepID=UPI00160BD12F|nr:acyltransferase family protein [Conyzicola lurida]
MTSTLTSPPVRFTGDRLAGLDGLRAIAVTLVVLFHVGAGLLPGGYLGVDIFFPVSGFLITSLLLRERTATGGIDVLGFWRRRARRLLPALALVLLACGAAAFFVGGDVLVGIGRQMLGASTFSYNWLAIADGGSYLDATTPELFRNLWSLAVEEQFYLVWPLLVVLLWAVPSRRFRLGFVLLVAAASALGMALLAADGATTRVYYGTDTHSFGLALGAALAIVRHDWPGALLPTTRRERAFVGAGGLVAVAALVAIAMWMPESGSSMYEGGLARVAVFSVIAIACVTVPGSLLGRSLDAQPLRWIGERSYGLYLWHWPVFVLVTAAQPSDASALVTALAAVAITVVVSALSYRFVEQPIRRIGLRAGASRFTRQWRRDHWGRDRAAFTRATVVSVAAVAALALSIGAIASDPGDGLAEARIRAGAAAIAEAEAREAAEATPAPTVAPDLPSGDKITAIGDSVMLAVAPELTAAFPGISIDAVVSRQMSAAPGIVQGLVDSKQMRPYLLLGLGTNGSISADTLQKVKDIVGRRTQIVLVDVQAPRGWTDGVNTILHGYADRMRTVELARWQEAIQPRLDLLAQDQIHAGGPVGGGIYVGAVSDALTRLVEQPELNGGPHDSGDKIAER